MTLAVGASVLPQHPTVCPPLSRPLQDPPCSDPISRRLAGHEGRKGDTVTQLQRIRACQCGRFGGALGRGRTGGCEWIGTKAEEE
jgi:hypothetical protein